MDKLSPEEKKLNDAFNQARVAKIREQVKKDIEMVHLGGGTAEEVFKIIHEGNMRILLIISHS